MFPKIHIIIPIWYLILLQLTQLQFAYASSELDAEVGTYLENAKFVFFVGFAVPNYAVYETSMSSFISSTIAFTQKYPSACYDHNIIGNPKNDLKKIKSIAFHNGHDRLAIPFGKSEFTLIPVSEDLLIIRLLETHHRLEEHIFEPIPMSKDPITSNNIEDFLFYFYSSNDGSFSIEQGVLYLDERIMLFPKDASLQQFPRHLGGPVIAFNIKVHTVSVIGLLSGCIQTIGAFLVELTHPYYSTLIDGLMDSRSEYAFFAQSSIPISQQSGHKGLKFKAPIAFDAAVRSSVYVGQRIILSFIPTKHLLAANCLTLFFNVLDVNAGMVIIKLSDGGIYYYLDQSDAMVVIVVPKFVEDTKYVIKALLSKVASDITLPSYFYATNVDFEGKTVSVDGYPIDIRQSAKDGSLTIGEKIVYQRDIGSPVGFENEGTLVVTAMVQGVIDGRNVIKIVLTYFIQNVVSYFVTASGDYKQHIAFRKVSEFFKQFKAIPGYFHLHAKLRNFLIVFLKKISSRTDDPKWKSYASTTLYRHAESLLQTLDKLDPPYIIPAAMEPQIDTILKFFF